MKIVLDLTEEEVEDLGRCMFAGNQELSLDTTIVDIVCEAIKKAKES